ncbi:MAG: class I tRNA ligase family protein, partial [Nanoarchaeota archaeon]|nr:class I tRNA ligase family protein [Nanoarchaeota archaeon]
MDLPQHYTPKESEPKWQQYWEEQELFVFHPDPKKETYSIDTPPPTVSGKMHIGHAFSYTQQDIIARYQRMQGKNVFFPFGTDDNGLPTERLIEKKKNILSTRMSRSDFVKICNEVIEEEKPIFIQSWKNIGMSADFKRSYSTINKHCQITSQASFIDLYKKGRIYQQESPVSWCVACQTAIAQAEFENVDMTSHFNDIIFKCGATDLVIATTRPELIPACVALFHHPDDERYKHLKGKFAQVPLFKYEVPILADAAVDKEKGTGLMMVCTFGDKEDVDKWFRYSLPLRVVLTKDGRMNELANEFKGIKIKEARKNILDKLKESGFLLKQKDITHAVNVHERCKTELE